MELLIRTITPRDAEQIAGWHYREPYSLYNLSPDAIPTLLDPKNRYYAVTDTQDILVGYGCFGCEGMLVGGEYRKAEPEVLDVGVGLRPELTGRGWGALFISAILDFAAKQFEPQTFRVTIAEFNQRSIRAFEGLGFKETHRFNRPTDDMPFIQFERPAQKQD